MTFFTETKNAKQKKSNQKHQPLELFSMELYDKINLT